MLSDQERRQLGELEVQLETEDPRLAGKFRSAGDHTLARLFVAVLVMIAGVVTTVTGLALPVVPVAVVGLVLLGAGGCIAAGWRR
jgi:Protein of unknown function (DUF3040)